MIDFNLNFDSRLTGLWQNPSPSSPFEEQDIVLSDSVLNYDFILITVLLKWDNDHPIYANPILVPTIMFNFTGTPTNGSANINDIGTIDILYDRIYHRKVQRVKAQTDENKKLHFTLVKSTSGASNASWDTSAKYPDYLKYAIPMTVYGIKVGGL